MINGQQGISAQQLMQRFEEQLIEARKRKREAEEDIQTATFAMNMLKQMQEQQQELLELRQQVEEEAHA